MTLALRLAQQHHAVTLFEAAPFLGGVAAPWTLEDIVWDRHYHVILQSDADLRALLRELGLEDQIVWKKTRTGFYIDSQFHSLSNALEFLQFPPLRLSDKLRLATTILVASRINDSRQLEGVLAEDWLTKWSGRTATQKLWVPLLRAKLGESYRDTSAAFIWATIARLYGARRSGAKTEVFGYIPGGYARIVEKFQKLLLGHGVKVRLGQAARSITPDRTGKLQLELAASSELFDRVAVTTAAPLAARICPRLTAEEKIRLQAIKYQGIVCASMLLRNALSDFYLTNIADSEMPYTGVIEMSALVDRHEFGGRALVYLPKYVFSESPYFNLPDDQIRKEFESGLAQMYPRFRQSDVLCFQVSRVKYLLPIPTIDYSRNLPQARTSIRGLHIVNSAQIVNGTLNVNETVRLAESAAKDLASEVRAVA